MPSTVHGAGVLPGHEAAARRLGDLVVRAPVRCMHCCVVRLLYVLNLLPQPGSPAHAPWQSDELRRTPCYKPARGTDVPLEHKHPMLGHACSGGQESWRRAEHRAAGRVSWRTAHGPPPRPAWPAPRFPSHPLSPPPALHFSAPLCAALRGSRPPAPGAREVILTSWLPRLCQQSCCGAEHFQAEMPRSCCSARAGRQSMPKREFVSTPQSLSGHRACVECRAHGEA